jgi:hypothetical protein
MPAWGRLPIHVAHGDDGLVIDDFTEAGRGTGGTSGRASQRIMVCPELRPPGVAGVSPRRREATMLS